MVIMLSIKDLCHWKERTKLKVGLSFSAPFFLFSSSGVVELYLHLGAARLDPGLRLEHRSSLGLD